MQNEIKRKIKKVIRELDAKKDEANYWFLHDLKTAKMSEEEFYNRENIALDDANYQNGHENGYEEAIDLLNTLLMGV